MGKRNVMVVLSSEDDEDDSRRCLGKRRSGSLSKSRSAGRSANPREPKRTRLSGSRSRSRKEPGHVDEVMLSFEGFDEALNGFKVPAGSETCKTKDLWVDKYRPNSLEELAVHKKKVEEIKTWLEERSSASKDKLMNNVLLVTGPAGVGKSASIHVIATSLGIGVCQWDAPTPTIWLEHMHNSTSGLQYTSKLDEFENFLERTTKYGQITSPCNDSSKLSTILMIDDLPLTNGRHSFERLQRCLLRLVGTALIPTVILFTNYNKADSSDQNSRSMEELQSSLESAGACKVSFNPITKSSIRKTLLRICKKEHCNLTAEEIDLIANVSGGDIRHAITSLQLLALNQKPCNGNSTFSISTPSYFGDEETRCNTLDSAISSRFGRDETLSLFHALGKFLHNKRDTENPYASGCNKFLVSERFLRLPLKMDAPEKVLCQAHGHARPVTDFLHENVLDFLGDEAIDDAWSVTSYLADADMLLASFHGILARHNETENVLQSAAASIAVRGVQYGNTNPLSSRWHSIRKPKLWQVEQATTQNKIEIMKQRCECFDGSSRVFKSSVVATEVRPALKWLGFRASGEHRVNNNIMKEQDSDISEDEIEEW